MITNYKRVSAEEARSIIGIATMDEVKNMVTEKRVMFLEINCKSVVEENDYAQALADSKPEDVIEFQITGKDEREWYGQPGGLVGWVERADVHYQNGVFSIVRHFNDPFNDSGFRHNVDQEEEEILPLNETFWDEIPLDLEDLKNCINEEIATADEVQIVTIAKYLGLL